jgi:hypothetical protein
VSDRVAAAASTLATSVIVPSAVASKVEVPRAASSRDWLTVVVPSLVDPSPEPKSKFWPGPPPSVGASAA